MDCGIPFCHHGCPLGNLIPEWNDLVWRDDWQAAIERLHATNNFPEFTGRLCPAPCEAACVLGINQRPGHDQAGRGRDHRPGLGRGLGAAAAARAADRQDRRRRRLRPGRAGRRPAAHPGRPHGRRATSAPTASAACCATASPSSRWRSATSTGGSSRCAAEGTRFRTGVDVGVDLTADALRARYDAVVLAVGATAARDLPVPGRELDGVHQAMEYLPHANRAARDPTYEVPISAEGKHVVIIGGGDTGADCLGTAHRQGAASVTQLEILPRPRGRAAERQPVADLADDLPHLQRARGGRRAGLRRHHQPASWATTTATSRAASSSRSRWSTGRFDAGRGHRAEIPAELVLLAMGFTGPQQPGLVEQLGVELDPRGNVARDADFMTSVPGVFVAGDAGRGQSLIVWAIAEGRAAAAGVDAWLRDARSTLPRPIQPTARPVSV